MCQNEDIGRNPKSTKTVEIVPGENGSVILLIPGYPKRDSAGKISGVVAIGSVEGKQALSAMSKNWIQEGREGCRNFTYLQ